MLILHQALQELSLICHSRSKPSDTATHPGGPDGTNANDGHEYSATSFIRCFHCLYLTVLSVDVAIPECLRLGDLGTSEGDLETHRRKSLVPASSRHVVMWRKEGTRVQWEPGLTFLIHLHNKHALLERLRSVPPRLNLFQQKGKLRACLGEEVQIPALFCLLVLEGRGKRMWLGSRC